MSDWDSDVDRIKEIDSQLEAEVSPTFCLAKWHHTSIYLQSGQTHSCYHPSPHAIDLEEIKENPAHLHNTKVKKRERAEMLIGEKPDGCKYCWNVESLGDTHISDRMIRNSSIYRDHRMEEIRDNPWDFNINPEYVEVAFSNECNFKCGYCHPISSTSFYNEIKKHGPFDMVKNHALDIDWFKPYDEDSNPYVDAWWKWWPEMSKTLNILRITGGEPLLHKSTWRLFEMLHADPKPNLELNMNSNLGMVNRHVKKLSENVNSLLEKNAIKKFKLFTSIDTWGPRAEYLRTGLNIDQWQENQDTYLRQVRSHITHMCTFNILSVTSFKEYLEMIIKWREEYNEVIPVLDETNPHDRKIRFDTPYLKEPLQYDMHILPKEYVSHFDDCLQYMSDNLDDNDPMKFSKLEFEKFRRVRDYFEQVKYEDHKIKQGRADFYRWFTELDRRRDTNFLDTFPDMEEFWNMCKKESDNQIEVRNV